MSVHTAYYAGMDVTMDEKAVATIVAINFEMELNAVGEQDAYETYFDAMDIMTGDYDDLMSETYCKLFKADIKKVMDYLDAHP